MSGTEDRRGVAPVVSTILMVAVVVILAATVTVLALGFTEKTTETGPTIGESSGTLEANTNGSDNGFVQITHLAGDTVRVENIEIAVDATDACGKSGRLVNLPADPNNGIQSSNIEGDNVFDERSPWFVSERNALHESRFSAGEVVEFRIPNEKCSIQPNDEVVVSVVHVPTNSVLIREELSAVDQ